MSDDPTRRLDSDDDPTAGFDRPVERPAGRPAATWEQPASPSQARTQTYGAPPPAYREPQVVRYRTSGAAVAALVLGLLALVFGVIPVLNLFAIVLGGLAVIVGIVGVSATAKLRIDGRGMAVAGIVTGLLGLLFGILLLVLFGAAVNQLRQGFDSGELQRQFSEQLGRELERQLEGGTEG
ncbi:MAG: DUF4190 domain-containing protein [Egibacteraceae bacterium]